jgi:ATP-dependent DNA helicase RecG
LRLLRVLRDEKLIEEAREVAGEILESDGGLERYPLLKQELEALKSDYSATFIDKG